MNVCVQGSAGASASYRRARKAKGRSEGCPDLHELGGEFRDLQARLRGLLVQQQSWPTDKWTEDLEAKWADITDPIRNQIAELREAIIGRSARSFSDLRVKAVVLLDLLDRDSEDLLTRASLSLCNDVMDLTSVSS